MQEQTLSPRAQITFWLLAIGIFLLIVWVLRPMLLPFVAGLAIAYFLNPPVQTLCRIGWSRSVSASVVILLAIMIAVAILLLIVPLLESQLTALINAAPGYTAALREKIIPWLTRMSAQLSPEDVDKLRGAAGEHVGEVVNWFGQLLRRLLSGGLAIFDILSLLFITPLVAFYVLRDWDHLTRTIDRALPRQHYETINAQLREIDQTLAGFVRGQALVCLTLGVFYASGLSLIGLEFGAAVGLAAGLLSFIPYVGTTFGWMTSLILGAIQFAGWEPLIAIIVVFVIGQIAEGYFLTPKLVGDRVKLHPVWILFGLFAGASLFGFLGLLIAVPLSAVIGVLIRFAMRQYQSSPYYDET